MASWRAPGLILEASGFDFGAPGLRVWSLRNHFLKVFGNILGAADSQLCYSRLCPTTSWRNAVGKLKLHMAACRLFLFVNGPPAGFLFRPGFLQFLSIFAAAAAAGAYRHCQPEPTAVAPTAEPSRGPRRSGGRKNCEMFRGNSRKRAKSSRTRLS